MIFETLRCRSFMNDFSAGFVAVDNIYPVYLKVDLAAMLQVQSLYWIFHGAKSEGSHGNQRRCRL
jgi:hypothetical protein